MSLINRAGFDFLNISKASAADEAVDHGGVSVAEDSGYHLTSIRIVIDNQNCDAIQVWRLMRVSARPGLLEGVASPRVRRS